MLNLHFAGEFRMFVHLLRCVGDARSADGGQRGGRHQRLAALWVARSAGLSNAAQAGRLGMKLFGMI